MTEAALVGFYSCVDHFMLPFVLFSLESCIAELTLVWSYIVVYLSVHIAHGFFSETMWGKILNKSCIGRVFLLCGSFHVAVSVWEF